MKRAAVAALLVLSLISSMGITVFAVNASMSFEFVLETADKTQQLQVDPGEEFTIDLILRCTSIDAGKTYTLHMMQTEIVYDKDLLEFKGAEYIEKFEDNSREVATRDLLNREGNYQRIMINSGAKGAHLEYPATMTVARMTFVAKSDGVTYITNENAKMSTAAEAETAVDEYLSTVKDVTVTIGKGGTEPEPDDTYAIAIVNPAGGTITTNPVGTATAGATVTLGMALSTNYSLNLWTVTAADGSRVSVTNSGLIDAASFVMPAQAVTVSATLTYNDPNGGSGGSGGGTGAANPEREITIDDEGTPMAAPEVPRFDDVGTGHWAYVYVEYLAALGFVNGKTPTMYEPGDNITRGEFVTILARMSGEALPDYNSEFEDVGASNFYAKAVAWGYANGIVKGTSATTFSPEDNVSRQDIAVMIARYAEYKGYGFGKTNDAAEFTDNSDIASYAGESVSAMQQANIINGYDDGSFRPKGSATRAECAKMLALVHHAMFPDLLSGYYD